MSFSDHHEIDPVEDKHNNICPIAGFSQQKSEGATNEKKDGSPSHDSSKTISQRGSLKSEGVIGRNPIKHWNMDEKKRYYWFLEVYHQHFLLRHLRRLVKIFTLMENFLGTRGATQCRSHHQKMEKKYGNFRGILLHLRKEQYGTDDPHLVRQDLLKNNIKIPYGICEAKQLYQVEKKGDQESHMELRQKVEERRQQANDDGQGMAENYLNFPDLQQLFR